MLNFEVFPEENSVEALLGFLLVTIQVLFGYFRYFAFIPPVKGSLHGSNSLSTKSKTARLLQKHTKAHYKVYKVKMPSFYMAKKTQKELKHDQRVSTNIGLHQGQTGVACTPMLCYTD